MKSKIIIFLLLFQHLLIFGYDEHDRNISRELFDVYGDNITKEQIELVLEYDEFNNEALYIKAKQLDVKGVSLKLAAQTLEKSSLDTVESQYHYVSLLYRLKKYDKIVSFIKRIDIDAIKNVDILFYIADSFYRLNLLEDSLEIINSAIYLHPDETLLHELRYLINKDKISLRKIWFSEKVTEHFVRIYNRQTKVKDDDLIEILIKHKLNTNDVEILNLNELNYSVIDLIYETVNISKLEGKLYIDSDSDTFADTFVTIKNGLIEYKGIDVDGDQIVDVEYYVSGDKVDKIREFNITLNYSDYPFIDKIDIEDTITKSFKFYKDEAAFEFNGLMKEYSGINFNEIIKIGKLEKVTHETDSGVKTLFEYIDNDTVKVYLDKNRQFWDKVLLVKNNSVVAGVRDLDSDGVYDLLESYMENKLIDIKYKPLKANDADLSKSYYPNELPYLEVSESVMIDEDQRGDRQKWWKQ